MNETREMLTLETASEIRRAVLDRLLAEQGPQAYWAAVQQLERGATLHIAIAPGPAGGRLTWSIGEQEARPQTAKFASRPRC